MSTETLAVIISGAALLLSFFGSFAWLVRRSDTQWERLEERLGARIDAGDAKLGDRIERVERELVEVTVAIARIEGPPRRWLAAR